MNGKFQVAVRSCRPCLIDSIAQHHLLINGLYSPRRETCHAHTDRSIVIDRFHGTHSRHFSWSDSITVRRRTLARDVCDLVMQIFCRRKRGFRRRSWADIRYVPGDTSGGSAESWLPVYDLIANRRSMRIGRAHSNDVNSVCWADTASGNVLISGSDDGFVKVW